MAVTLELGVQQAFGSAGCPFGTEQAIQLGAGANKVVANSVGAGVSANTSLPGWFMVLLSANDKLQYTPDGGVTFRDLVAAGGSLVFYSDGFNFRILNTGVADVGGIFTRLVPILII